MARAVLAALLLAGLVGGCGHGGCGRHADAVGGSPVVAQHRVAPRQLDLTVRSAALGRSAKVRLLTPVGWTSSSKRWPVLYLLHGCCDTYESWTRSTDIADLPQLRDVLVVMPEGGDIGFYSNWKDGPRWQDFHLRELPRILEPYGAGPRRAIAGLSMGGLGAMDYAARRPRMFRAAASFSGVLHPLGVPRFWLGLFSSTRRIRARSGAIRRPTARLAPARPDRAAAGARRGSRCSSPPATGGVVRARARKRDAIEAEVGAESRAFARRARALASRSTPTSTPAGPTTGRTGSASCTAPCRCCSARCARTEISESRAACAGGAPARGARPGEAPARAASPMNASSCAQCGGPSWAQPSRSPRWSGRRATARRRPRGQGGAVEQTAPAPASERACTPRRPRRSDLGADAVERVDDPEERRRACRS